jgi:tetratricopeptide (TPR) repeat protein
LLARATHQLAEAWAHRGGVWFAKRDLAQAIADYDQALKLNPDLADAYCSRGVTRLAQSNPAKAKADFAQCRALGGALKPEAEELLREMKMRRAPK